MTSTSEASATEWLSDDCLPPMPYPGLRPFRKTEWSIFFGRDRMISDVLHRLAKTKLVVVHGSSGSGKSSLILAGVLPRLELEHARHGIPWKTATMRPGSAPLWHLAEAIAELVHDEASDEEIPLSLVRKIRRVLNRGKRALYDLADMEGIELGQHRQVCLVLDQFEELFRFARGTDWDEAEILSNALLGFDSNLPPGVHAIITMRSDHLGDCGRFQGLAELINQTQYLLPRMDREALLRAIRDPAKLYHGQATIDLALKLIEDSAGEQDALPLVQHCLMRLWCAKDRNVASLVPSLAEQAAPFDDGRDHRPARILDLPGYRGLRETLSEHADEILAELIETEPGLERLVEHLFRALTDVDAEGRTIRSPRRLHQLVSITGGQQNRTVLIRIIERLRQDDCSFLTPFAEHPIDDETMIDIGHEALIRCWRRLDDSRIDKGTGLPRGWLQREQEDERLWRSLLVQAEAGDQIAASVIDDREKRFAALPDPGWAERYGGGWQEVAALIKTSRETIQRSKWIRWATAALVFGLAVAHLVYLLNLNAEFDADLSTQRTQIGELQTELTKSHKVQVELSNRLEELAVDVEASEEAQTGMVLDTVVDQFETIQDCADVCPKMVVIPAGSFLMGSPANEEGRREHEEGRREHEGPLHEVNVPAFAIGKFEVTFEEYDRFAEATERNLPNDEGWGRKRRPVINVSWEDARAYCAWLGEETDKPYRLPSEAEWEYAARAGTTTRYAFGDDISANQANFSQMIGKTREVGSYRPNNFGLFDMHGNVREWVEDHWHTNYEGAPNNGSPWLYSGSKYHVLRGGAWTSKAVYLRSAYRSYREKDFRYNFLGFRCARDHA